MSIKVYGILAVIIIVGGLGVWYLYLSLNPQVIKEDFENGFGEWAADADVPLDPDNPGHFVEWSITHVSRFDQNCLKLFIDGRQADGTIWIERIIGVEKDSEIQIAVSFKVYSEYVSSANVMASVCAYVGVGNPEVEEDFVVLGSANELVGWKKYMYAITLHTGSSEEASVAVGLTVRWETYMTYYLDDVEIEIR